LKIQSIIAKVHNENLRPGAKAGISATRNLIKHGREKAVLIDVCKKEKNRGLLRSGMDG
jgi:hypothetical protein